MNQVWLHTLTATQGRHLGGAGGCNCPPPPKTQVAHPPHAQSLNLPPSSPKPQEVTAAGFPLFLPKSRCATILTSHLVLYISRIRRNLSIHIARFSASESPRAYTNTPKNPHFSLVAGTSQGAMRRGSDSACVSIPHGHSLLAFAISCVHFSSRLFNLFLPFYLHFVHLFLLIPFCD